MRVDAQQNRRDIIEAAWQQFSADGPQASLRAIAAQAGVGIATLYRHFPSRDDLLLGVVREVNARVVAVARDHGDGWVSDPEGHWRDFVHAMVGLRIGTLIAQMAPVAAGIGTFDEQTRGVRAETLGVIDEILDAARAARLVRADLDAARFFAALAVLSRPLPDPAPALLTLDDAWLVDVFVDGLCPRG